MRKVNWGVIGTAGIAKGQTIPGMQEAINKRTGVRVTVAKRPMDCGCMGLGHMLKSTGGDF